MKSHSFKWIRASRWVGALMVYGCELEFKAVGLVSTVWSPRFRVERPTCKVVCLVARV